MRGPVSHAPLIIGGGPAGAAAAILLATAGHPVTLVERSAGPTDKLCGDFLSGGAVAGLQELGMDPHAMGAMPLRTIRLVHRLTAAEATLPFAAAGLSRRTLDEALLRVAMQRGATVLRGQMVQGLAPGPSGFTARISASPLPVGQFSAVPPSTGPLSAGTVFLATGKHDLRGLSRPHRADGLLGLKMYYTLAADQRTALSGSIELHLLRGGYAGLQLVEGGRAVLCMLLPAVRYRQVGADWAALLADLAAEAPLLERRLAGATTCLGQPLAIAGTPYGHLHRPPPDMPPGLFRLGDQACVVPSLTGDGMAIALQTAFAATAVWLRGGTAREYHARFARQAGRPLRFARLIHAVCRSAAAQAVAASACRAWPNALSLAASLSRVAPPS